MAVKIGALIDKLEKLRLIKKKTAAADKEAKEAYDTVVADLMDIMNEQGIEKAAGKTASVTLGEQVVATIDDFDKLEKFIKRNNALYLFERRISSAAFRELLEQRKGKAVPGLVKFTKHKLNMRAIAK